MDSLCGRESSLSPPTVVAPVAVKPSPPISDAHPIPTDQQRLLYQLALAERLRLASAGLAWARPPLAAHHPTHLQDTTIGGHIMGGLMTNPLMGGLGGGALIGGLGSTGLPPALIGSHHQTPSGVGGPPPPSAYPPPHPLYGYRLMDPRLLMPRGPEEPKPQHSYIGLIAMAILSSPDNKLILADIYQYILDHYSYFRTRGPGWRNSIRHNLSLNDCFIKSGRSANGKGHYWAIHPANVDDFRRGDFRRRRAQRRVRKHLGLAVDDDSSPEPPSPTASLSLLHHTTSLTTSDEASSGGVPQVSPGALPPPAVARKRQFDVASLLAPDDKMPKTRRHDQDQDDHQPTENEPRDAREQHHQEEIDVVCDEDDDDDSSEQDARPRIGASSPSPTPTAAQDDDDDQRAWSLLGWVSGRATWPPIAAHNTEPRPTHDPPTQ